MCIPGLLSRLASCSANWICSAYSNLLEDRTIMSCTVPHLLLQQVFDGKGGLDIRSKRLSEAWGIDPQAFVYIGYENALYGGKIK